MISIATFYRDLRNTSADCLKKKKDGHKKSSGDGRKRIGYIRGKPRHIAKLCEKKEGAGIATGSHYNYVGAAMISEVAALIGKSREIEISKRILYSGSTRHMTSCQDRFLDFVERNGRVEVENSKLVHSQRQEAVKIVATVGLAIPVKIIQNVLYVPEIKHSLIFVSKATN